MRLSKIFSTLQITDFAIPDNHRQLQLQFHSNEITYLLRLYEKMVNFA